MVKDGGEVAHCRVWRHETRACTVCNAVWARGGAQGRRTGKWAKDGSGGMR